jgi:hypothetical protein
MESSLHLSPSLTGMPTPTSHYAQASGGVQSQYPLLHSHPNAYGSPPSPDNHSPTHRLCKSEGSQHYHPLVGSPNRYPSQDWSYAHQALPLNYTPAIPPLSFFNRPHRLEVIAPRETISRIIALFFDYVYPLMPCVHKPSFMTDFNSRREERDPLFFALVMSTVASTLVQIPRSYLPMERHSMRRLARTCYEASRLITMASYDPPSVTHVVIRYL